MYLLSLLLLALAACANAENLRRQDLVSNCDENYIFTGLYGGKILRPGEYLVEYGPGGEPEFKFGLNCDGLFGLWLKDELIWSPSNDDSEQIKCEKLRFQGDNGHLTCYNVENSPDGTYRLDHRWKSNCKDEDYPNGLCGSHLSSLRKISLVGGDVYQFDGAGQVVWRLPGSRYYTSDDEDIEPICRPSLDGSRFVDPRSAGCDPNQRN